jgi:4-aminobutyrate aminotransferase-like enzyme
MSTPGMFVTLLRKSRLHPHRSQQLFDTLNDLKNGEATKHLIKDVRGKGLMIG